MTDPRDDKRPADNDRNHLGSERGNTCSDAAKDTGRRSPTSDEGCNTEFDPELLTDEEYEELVAFDDMIRGMCTVRVNVSSRDPLLEALANAPEDDELETPEEAAAIEEAKAAIARGEVDSLDDVRDRLLRRTPRDE